MLPPAMMPPAPAMMPAMMPPAPAPGLPVPEPSHPNRCGANRDTRPAWMTKGIGVGTALLGEATGDLVKPGMTKAQYEEIQTRGVSDGPDPFGDIFRERSSASSVPVVSPAGSLAVGGVGGGGGFAGIGNGNFTTPNFAAGQRRAPLPDQGSLFATEHPDSISSMPVAASGSGAPVAASQFNLRKDYWGYIKSFNDLQGRGWIHCDEILQITGGDIYVHKSVIEKSMAGVGDTVQFKLHISPKGIPQAQGPVSILQKGKGIGKGGGKDAFGAPGPAAFAGSEYYGFIKSFNETNGYGFVACPESFHMYGRDVFLPFEKAAGFCVGAEVCFTIYCNPKGEPCISEIWPPEWVMQGGKGMMKGDEKGWKGGSGGKSADFGWGGEKGGAWSGYGEKGAAWGGYGEKGGYVEKGGYGSKGGYGEKGGFGDKGGFGEKGGMKSSQGLKRPFDESSSGVSAVSQGTKRQLCSHWQQNRCKKGAECTFAHGEQELGQTFQGAPGFKTVGPQVNPNTVPVNPNTVPLNPNTMPLKGGKGDSKGDGKDDGHKGGQLGMAPAEAPMFSFLDNSNASVNPAPQFSPPGFDNGKGYGKDKDFGQKGDGKGQWDDGSGKGGTSNGFANAPPDFSPPPAAAPGYGGGKGYGNEGQFGDFGKGGKGGMANSPPEMFGGKGQWGESGSNGEFFQPQTSNMNL